MDKYYQFRNSYKNFIYKSFTVEKTAEEIVLTYHFETEGLTSFTPCIKIPTEGMELCNDYNSNTAKRIAFLLGMCECVSYLKATCSPVLKVECGSLTSREKLWWRKLYFNGLGEFFYRNGINASLDDFLTIDAEESEARLGEEFICKNKNLIPIGGGKDSAVTVELLRAYSDKNFFFTVNDQQARLDTVEAAGYDRSRIIRTYRRISPELLQLNSQGFLNGHTPFSAIVAFLSLYCAYITGSENIILSNEASANESNIEGSTVNHQYSKSYEFERDFSSYVKSLGLPVRYFSLLRPFTELQIAAEFARHPQYHGIFRSCNVGSKKNIWCSNCAKCLFVFCILSPFLSERELCEIFGENLLEKRELLEDLKGLTALSPVKPFECVGTAAEVCFALELTIQRLKRDGEALPLLLDYYDKNKKERPAKQNPLLEFNSEHNIPPQLITTVREMYNYVSNS